MQEIKFENGKFVQPQVDVGRKRVVGLLKNINEQISILNTTITETKAEKDALVIKRDALKAELDKDI